jgi:hypothetical protein
VNQSLKNVKPIDFEEFGFQTMLHSDDEDRAKNICGLHLHAYADQLQPEISSLNSEIEHNKHHGLALHAQLYDRPIPVNDAAMLTHSLTSRTLLVLTVLAAIACFAGNTTTFYLFGFGPLLTLLMAAGTTALPLVVGHLAYERILAGHKGLQAAVIVVAVALCFGGLFQLAEARRDMVDKAAATPPASSYVDGTPADTPTDQEPSPQEGSESKVRQTLGGAILMIMIAADLALGFLVGQLTRMHTNEDYAAWRKLKKIGEVVRALEMRVSELVASIEIAKKRCMAGILRAQSGRNKRRIPYHKILTTFIFILFVLLSARRSLAQTIERYEGILIDTSGSISKGGTTNDLFHEYLISTKKLLMTEPANSRVWVSSISRDSFGGVREVVKGWTPDARGVFTDDLNRARRQLASSFEVKSSGMSPVASGTDIFGGLWHFKTLFEPVPKSDASRAFPKTIWIFSDMMNETQDFPMPTLIAIGPGQMLERAKANGLLVPLNGYKIYISGASPSGLTPQAWIAIKRFWTMYFIAAGAELMSYSAECDLQR